jgi:hypothetical protein
MKRLQTKPNTIAPDADYPYGDIKNDTGIDDGTPVDRDVYADFHQFFEKMFDESGLTANNLPDNATNGFQLYQAMLENIKKTTDNNAVYYNGIFRIEGLGDSYSMGGSGGIIDIFVKDNILYTIHASSTDIRRWDLVNNVAMSSLSVGFTPRGIFVGNNYIYLSRSTVNFKGISWHDKTTGVLVDNFAYSTALSGVSASKLAIIEGIQTIGYVIDNTSGGSLEGVVAMNLTTKTLLTSKNISRQDPIDIFIDTDYIYYLSKTQVARFTLLTDTPVNAGTVITIPDSSIADPVICKSIMVYAGKIYVGVNYNGANPRAYGLFAYDKNTNGTSLPGSIFIRIDLAEIFLYNGTLYTSSTAINTVSSYKQELIPNHV